MVSEDRLDNLLSCKLSLPTIESPFDRILCKFILCVDFFDWHSHTFSSCDFPGRGFSCFLCLFIVSVHDLISIYPVVEQAWEALERAEHERELALREELMRYVNQCLKVCLTK